MPLAKLAIRQPIFISMVLLALTLLGILSYLHMGVDLFPDISNPTVSVSTSFPGAAPDDVETLVTKPIEEAVSTLNGIDTISASSREGSSQIIINFVIGRDVQQAAQEVRERLDSVKRGFPDGVNDPTVRRFDPNQSPFLAVAVTFKGNTPSPTELDSLMNDLITPRLERLPGVASAGVNGLPVQEVHVDLIASKLKALGVSPQEVVAALRTENVVQPSGNITSTSERLLVRTSAQFNNLDEIRKLVVARRGNTAIQLQDVATAGIALQKTTNFVRLNGQDTITLEVRKQSGSNVVQTAAAVRQELQRISRDFPQLSFTIISDDSTFIEASDKDVTLTLILGALLAAAIVFVFFRNLRNTLITVAGLPIIVIGTFSIMALLGYTRNVISLMALSLSIGLLIDDAIVVRENIFRHMERGALPRQAAEEATGEIAFAVLAISLTIVAVFIPVAFTTGTVGVLFKQFGITVAVAVMVSLLEAFTLAPLLSAYLAKPLTRAEGAASAEASLKRPSRWSQAWPAVSNGYKAVLGWSLNHRWIVVGVAILSFVASLWLVRLLPMSFFPVSDQGILNVGIRMPPGTPLDKTDLVARDVEQAALAQPETNRVYARVGQGNSSNQGSLSIVLKQPGQTDAVIVRLRKSLSKYGSALSFSPARAFLGVGGGMGGGSVGSRPIQVVVRGPVALDTLNQVADQVIERLRTVPGVRDADKSLPPAEPELQVTMDRQRATHSGISATTVGGTIRTLVAGTTATQVSWNDQRMDVIVQLREQDRSNAAALQDIPVAGSGGQLWTLQSVASIQRGSGPAILERQERQRQITVGANLEGRSQGAAMPDVTKALAGLQLPAGVTWKFGGQQAQTSTAFGSLAFAMIFGMIFVYMVLASQFGSLIHPLTIMVALPLSAVGAIGALVAAHVDLTVIAMIGIILLMGLVTKNSILLVDFIIRYRKEGHERKAAVLAAGPVRLRPIVMTSLAIVLGMVPTALGIGSAGEFRAPMAIAVIGGVVSSTLLSLVVVPVVYTLLDDAVLLVSRPFRRKAQTVGSTLPRPISGAAGDPGRRDDKPGL